MPFSEAHYISPLIIKDKAKHIAKYQDQNYYATLWTSFLMGTSNVKSSVSTSETTLEITITIEVEDGPIKILFDHVPSVSLLFWPDQATARINRLRLWPLQDIVQNIVDKGCQLVPRSSPKGDVHSEWRISFSCPEVSLAQLCSTEQKQAYYFFKILYY